MLSKQNFDENYAIRIAAEEEHAHIFHRLLQDPRVDPTADSEYALGMACKNGHASVVALLLKDRRSSPTADDNFALRAACEHGHSTVVALLLQDKRGNPRVYGTYPLKTASPLDTQRLSGSSSKTAAPIQHQRAVMRYKWLHITGTMRL